MKTYILKGEKLGRTNEKGTLTALWIYEMYLTSSVIKGMQ